MAHNPIICAIDMPSLDHALALSDSLRGHVGALKLGLEFFMANGADGVRRIGEGGVPIFLDLKFHDIPNTVAKAISALKGLNIFMLTVHAAGGYDMMREAHEAAANAFVRKPLVIGVTVLTSMDEKDLQSIGIEKAITPEAHVLRLADLAKSAGLDGVVCSAHEIKALKMQCGGEFKLVVPGIRPEGSAKGDQKRVMTPRQAVDLGADFLVIGRPITQSGNPASAAEDICASIR